MRLLPGRGGVFQIQGGQGMLFDMAVAGRFPEKGEATRLVTRLVE